MTRRQRQTQTARRIETLKTVGVFALGTVLFSGFVGLMVAIGANAALATM